MHENEKLLQKKLFSTKEFTILKKELAVKKKTLAGEQSWTLPLERIGNRQVTEKGSKAFFLISLGVLALIIGTFVTLILLEIYPHWAFYFIYPINVGVALYFYSKSTLDSVYLSGGEAHVEFHRTVPSEEGVKEFIQKLVNHSKQYLKEKYAKIDHDLPSDDQISELQWLKNREVITEDEFNHLKKELLRGGPGKIGFQRSNDQ